MVIGLQRSGKKPRQKIIGCNRVEFNENSIRNKHTESIKLGLLKMNTGITHLLSVEKSEGYTGLLRFPSWFSERFDF